MSENDGAYPQFKNLAATRNQDGVAMPAREGAYVAAVTSAVAGLSIAIPVSHQDHLK